MAKSLKIRAWFLIIGILFSVPAFATDYYVSPSGSSLGDGSLVSPWDLKTALQSAGGTIQPGDTIWLRGGIYFPPTRISSLSGNNAPSGGYGWAVSLSGTAGNLITIRSYTGEWAQIDRPWRFGSSHHLRFRDLEFYNTLKGFDPGNPNYPDPRPWGHFDDNQAASGFEWINSVVHDVNNAWSGATAGEVIRGCLIWHVGMGALDHVTYNAPVTFSGNIVGWAIDDAVNLTYHPLTTVDSNIFFGTGQTAATSNGRDMLLGGSLIPSTYVVSNNYTYNKWTGAHTGASLTTDQNSVITGNTFVTAYPLRFYGTVASADVQGNTFVMNTGINFGVVGRPTNSGAWTFDRNAYYARSPYTVKFETNNSYQTFSEWKTVNPSFDTNSTATDSGLPADAVHVIPNADEAKRAHIAVYNWSGANNVTVSLAGVLNVGDSYQLYSAQNINAGPIQTGTYDGTSISIPLTNLSVAPLLYMENATTYYGALMSPPLTSPEFGAFVVVSSTAIVGGPTPPAMEGATHFNPFRNVFNPAKGESITIQFSVAQSGSATIRVYNRRGELIRTLLEGGNTGGDNQSVDWDGRTGSGKIVASGVYILILESGDAVQTKKVVVVK